MRLGFWAFRTPVPYQGPKEEELIVCSSSTYNVDIFINLGSNFRVIPESPRWLNQHGKYDKCQQVLAVIAKKNKKPVPDLETLKKAAKVDTEEEAKLQRYTYLDLFKVKTYAKRTLVWLVLW